MKKITKIKVSLSGNQGHKVSIGSDSRVKTTASGTKFKLKGQTT